MLKCGKLLKSIFVQMKHVTCIVHAMHNLCEQIRKKNSLVDEIIAHLKNLLTKNNDNKTIFHSVTKLAISKFPILTRWGTWINFSKFLFENGYAINDFLKLMDNKYDTKMAEIFFSQEFETQLRFCNEYYFVVEVINELEASKLSVEQQICKLNSVTRRIFDKSLSFDFKNCLDKNPDLEYFLNFNQFRSNNNEKIFTFVPLTSVEVERSFSVYKRIFDDQRRSFKTENLNTFVFLYFNKTL